MREMADKQIVITRHDYQKLSLLLQSEFTLAIGDKPYISTLRSGLLAARIVEPEYMDPEVVTMNSKVKLVDQDLNDDEIYTLVYPDQADINNGKLSILTPIGTAIFGCRVGDEVSGYASRMLIKEILFQPERAGVLL
jgi:regulator of nucleoside diphosphate kinase